MATMYWVPIAADGSSIVADNLRVFSNLDVFLVFSAFPLRLRASAVRI